MVIFKVGLENADVAGGTIFHKFACPARLPNLKVWNRLVNSALRLASSSAFEAAVTLSYVDEEGDRVALLAPRDLSFLLAPHTQDDSDDEDNRPVVIKIYARVGPAAAAAPSAAPRGAPQVVAGVEQVVQEVVGVVADLVRTAAEGVTVMETGVHTTRGDNDNNNSASHTREPTATTTTTTTTQGPTVTSSSSVPTIATTPEEEVPFVHGRHTCDVCLVTPIVGTRWHQTPDFDLCATCMEGRSDKASFVQAICDRDVHMQPRWRRRHERIVHRRGGRRRCGGRPMRRSPQPHDAALAEAIRRSILEQEQQQEPPVVAEEAVQEEVNRLVGAVVDSVPEEEEEVAQDKEQEEVVEDDHDEEEEDIVFSPPASTASTQTEPDMTIVESVTSSALAVDEDDTVNGSQPKDVSFAKDADGFGETARGLGQALDIIGSAIDDVLDANQGETVVEGCPSEGGDSWSVVEEEDDDDDKTQDNGLGEATQMLGSLLFHSDISSGGPTEAQMMLWSEHLSQLHELGFLDDKRNVEVIERLRAADIGVDSTEEVTVQRIVEEFLKE